jgi:phosphate:Na+ symporter
VQVFLSKVTEPLPSDDERQWFIGTVHALDHVRRLAETIEESAKVDAPLDSPDERRAVKLYADAMRSTAESAVLLEHTTARHRLAASQDDGKAIAIIEHLGRCSGELASLYLRHRRATLDSVASGTLTASDAIAHVDAVRLLDQRAHHAWRAAAYLAGVVT